MKLANKSILLIDDELWGLTYYTRALKEAGAVVHEVGSSDDAVELIAQMDQGQRMLGEFDCVVLDMGMPLPKARPAGLLDAHKTGGYILGKARAMDGGSTPVILFSQ